jgi:hypothetical protein
MSMLSFLRPEKTDRIKPSWTYKAHGKDSVIWKLLISPAGILTGEERNIETNSAEMFALNTISGDVLWRGIETVEKWWFGSELASRHSLYLHTFFTPDMPEARGIISLDIETGKERWRQPDFTLLFEANERVYAENARRKGKEILKLDLLSGEILEALERNPATISTLRDLAEVNDESNIYPTPLYPESELYEAISGMMQSALDVTDVRGSIDFAEMGAYLIFSYHQRITTPEAALRNLLVNELKVLDRESGEIVYSDTLNAETPFPVPDNFFINRGTLIYVKEKQQVVGVALR